MVQGIGPQWLCPVPLGVPSSPREAVAQLALGLGLAESALDAFLRGSGSASQYGLPALGQGGCFQAPACSPGLDQVSAQQQIIQNLLLLQQLQGVGCGPGLSPGRPAGMDTRTACDVLSKNFDQVATGKFKSIDKGSLEKIVASNDASPELKMAANTLLNNPAAIDQIAGAHKDCLAKGITKGDLNTVLSPGNTTLDGIESTAAGNHPPGSFEESVAVLRKHWDRAASGKFKTVDKGSLDKIVSSNDAPPELKAAANAILNNPSWLGTISGAHQDGPFIGEGRISLGDLNTVMSPGWRG